MQRNHRRLLKPRAHTGVRCASHARHGPAPGRCVRAWVAAAASAQWGAPGSSRWLQGAWVARPVPPEAPPTPSPSPPASASADKSWGNAKPSETPFACKLYNVRADQMPERVTQLVQPDCSRSSALLVEPKFRRGQSAGRVPVGGGAPDRQRGSSSCADAEAQPQC